MQKLERPKETRGSTYRMETGCGHLYVTVASDGNGYTEVFARMGKAGGCTTCQNDAMAVMITTAMRFGVPAGELIHRLKGIKCGNSTPGISEEDRILSCPDAIGKALERFINEDGKSQGT